MKTKRLLAASFLLFGALFLVPVMAQEEESGSAGGGKYGTGEDSITCVKNLSLYRQYAKQKNYADALPFWRITYNLCPAASKNIYIDGVNMYRWLIEKEKDETKKDLYVDTMMMIYDKRIENFNERGSVLGRKGIDLLRYRRNDQKYIQEGFNILDESVSLLKGKSTAPTLATYFTATVSLFMLNAIPADRVVSVWSSITPYLDAMLAKNPKDATALDVKNSVNTNFLESGAATAESLTKYYTPKLDASPDNVDLLKEITSSFSNIHGEDQEIYARAAELLYKKEPSADAAYSLAKLFLKKENYSKSSDYYKEAIDKETDAEKKAKYYYELATVTAQMGNPSQARNYALEATKLKANWGDPFILIAKLYANSSATCGTKEIEKKSVFWAATDLCVKAKSIDPNVAEEANNLISNYANYFPNREEVFFEGYTDGQAYQVGCWINEGTTVRTKK